MADLITLAEIKAYSGISSTNQDTEIKFLIPKVSELVKNYVGRSLIDFYSIEKTEVFAGGIPSLNVQELPINELSSVEVSTDYGKTYTKLVEFVDFAHNLETDTIDVVGTDRFPWYMNGYRITYTGGYSTVPEDIKLALADLVAYYMKADMSVKSTRSSGANGSQIEYVMNATLPSHIRRVLDAYRLVL